MAIQYGGQDITFEAAADLSTKQFHAVKLDSNGKMVLVNSAGEAAVGVLQDKPGNGDAGLVRVSGVTKVVAGGAITPGQLLTTDASGRVVAASNLQVAAGTTTVTSTAANGAILTGGITPQAIIGMALTSASAAGQVITMKLF